LADEDLIQAELGELVWRMGKTALNCRGIVKRLNNESGSATKCWLNASKISCR